MSLRTTAMSGLTLVFGLQGVTTVLKRCVQGDVFVTRDAKDGLDLRYPQWQAVSG